MGFTGEVHTSIEVDGKLSAILEEYLHMFLSECHWQNVVLGNIFGRIRPDNKYMLHNHWQ